MSSRFGIGRSQFFCSFGGRILGLNDDERRELAGFDVEISKLRQQKISRLRELAMQKGISALKLEDLKPECGKPFVEEARRDSGYKRAIVRDETRSLYPELAYLCASERDIHFENKEDTCGWVRGEAREERYNNIGPPRGSAGIRYYCKICGKMVGELIEVVS